MHGVETTTLYRPVGQKELDLIQASGWTAFPPRLDWQPIFYPVLNVEYATRIARDWNTRDEGRQDRGGRRVPWRVVVTRGVRARRSDG